MSNEYAHWNDFFEELRRSVANLGDGSLTKAKLLDFEITFEASLKEENPDLTKGSDALSEIESLLRAGQSRERSMMKELKRLFGLAHKISEN